MNNIPNNTPNKIEFNFTCYALKLLGHNLYSNPWTAVSEIVANGIDAKAKNIYVLVDLFNKSTAQIEIIDDGKGMTYQELCNKYTIIGRNKRIDTPNDKTVLGRKGIGKLAALFLSDKYYISTKSTSENSSWFVDVSHSKDEDIPSLERYNGESFVTSKSIWNELSTGTLIKLTNVNLQKIGTERLKALPVILSDYYLSDVINCSISVCIRQNPNDQIIFEPVKKHISFSTMYGIFDNTGEGHVDKLPKSVFLNKENELPEELDIRHLTKKFTDIEGADGTIVMESISGEKISADYHLKGWIGIHGSLTPEIQKRNDSDFNKILYHPNAIRLYVRGKLAVDNLMTYINNTQAFSNYIEGEICFDVLDDDRFEDISTSNREGYKKDDVRVKKLLEIVGKVVSKLIQERAKIGSQINEEYRKYMENKQKEEEEKRKAEEEAREKAETEARDARKAKEEAQEKQQKAEEEAKKYHAQSNTIFCSITEDQKSFSAKTHLVKTNALTIRNGITTLAKKIGINNYKELGAISVATDKILSSLKYSALAKFNIEDEFITEDLFVFCEEYLLNVLSKQYFDLKFKVSVEGEYIIRFNPQYVSLMLDNLVSNSIKSNSKEFVLNMIKNDTVSIIVLDDGDGFGNANTERIFEFGFSNTGGTGIGLYNVTSVIKKMKGQIFAQNNEPKGAKFVITLP